MTAILHRGFKNAFFLSGHIYFFQILFGLFYFFSIWLFYFPFLSWLSFPFLLLFGLLFWHDFLPNWVSSFTILSRNLFQIYYKGMEVFRWPSLILAHTGILVSFFFSDYSPEDLVKYGSGFRSLWNTNPYLDLDKRSKRVHGGLRFHRRK